MSLPVIPQLDPRDTTPTGYTGTTPPIVGNGERGWHEIASLAALGAASVETSTAIVQNREPADTKGAVIETSTPDDPASPVLRQFASRVPTNGSAEGGVLEVAKPRAPRKRPTKTAGEPAAPVQEAPTHRRAKTGAGARFNGDAPWLYHAVNIGVAVVALAMIAISWQGLSAVGAWLLLPALLSFLVPMSIDVALIVLTLARFPRKARGESTWILTVSAVGLACISAAANFFHVWEDTPGAAPALQRYTGASLAALMPFLALLMTEVLGMLSTKPTRLERAQARLAAQKAEAALKKPAARKKRPAR